MGKAESILQQAGRMLASVLLCYALVLQALFGSLAQASPLATDTSAFLTVICHADGTGDASSGDPAKDIKANHHCVLCQSGASVPAFLPPAPEATIGMIDQRASILAYGRRQDPATAPLYLPPRLSRGPPLAA